MLKFKRMVKVTCWPFEDAQNFSEYFDEEVWVLRNPKTGGTIYTANSGVAAERRERGWVDVGRYVSGKLVKVDFSMANKIE